MNDLGPDLKPICPACRETVEPTDPSTLQMVHDGWGHPVGAVLFHVWCAVILKTGIQRG